MEDLSTKVEKLYEDLETARNRRDKAYDVMEELLMELGELDRSVQGHQFRVSREVNEDTIGIEEIQFRSVAQGRVLHTVEITPDGGEKEVILDGMLMHISDVQEAVFATVRRILVEQEDLKAWMP